MITLFFNQDDNIALYGVDWDAPLTSDDDAEAVEVPATINPLTSRDYLELQQSVDPTVGSDSHGVDHYLNTGFFC